MKIIEGTAGEIIKYYNERSYADKSNTYKIEAENSTDNLCKSNHWSKTKQRWIPIMDMDKTYILNVIRERIKIKSAITNINGLLEDEEFKALIEVLAYKLREDNL